MSKTDKAMIKKCDPEIGGCSKETQQSNMVTIIRGRYHLCPKCAGEILFKHLFKIKEEK